MSKLVKASSIKRPNYGTMNSSPQHPTVQGSSYRSVVAGEPVGPEKLRSEARPHTEDPEFPPLSPPSKAYVAGGRARKRAPDGDGGDRDPRPSSPATQEGSPSTDEAPSRSLLRAAKRASRASKKAEQKALVSHNPITGPEADRRVPTNPELPAPEPGRIKRATVSRAIGKAKPTPKTTNLKPKPKPAADAAVKTMRNKPKTRMSALIRAGVSKLKPRSSGGSSTEGGVPEGHARRQEMSVRNSPDDSSDRSSGKEGPPEIVGLQTISFVDALQEEYPDAQPHQIRACLVCSENAEGRPNLLRAGKLLRCLLQAGVEGDNVLADGEDGPSALRRPFAPANTGKHRATNRIKRRAIDSDDERIFVRGGAARAVQLAAMPKRRREPEEQCYEPEGPSPDTQDDLECKDENETAGIRDVDTPRPERQDAKTQDPKTKTKDAATQNGQDTAHSAPANGPLCASDTRTPQEQMQLVSDAISAIQRLAECSQEVARDRFMYYLAHTGSVEDATTLAIQELRAPITEVSKDRGTFVEMAQAHLAAKANQPLGSSLRPLNLSRLWGDGPDDPNLSNLTHGERAKVARRHAGESLHDEALSTLQQLNQQRGAFDSPPVRHAELQTHPNSAVRMAAQREFKQASVTNNGPVVVVAGAGARPFQWKQGTEKEQKGFFWSTKLAVQQAWESSNRMDGEHAYRSFKSLVHQSMVPVICFELGLSPTEWEAISDAELLSRIDAVLKPRDSTEYFLKLSAMRVDCNPSNGSLQARYRAFAEPFIATLAEAVESGMPVNPEQAKNAFKAGCSGHSLLKLWLSECKWKSVVEMHQRLVKGIRQYEAESVLRFLDCDSRHAAATHKLFGVRAATFIASANAAQCL